MDSDSVETKADRIRRMGEEMLKDINEIAEAPVNFDTTVMQYMMREICAGPGILELDEKGVPVKVVGNNGDHDDAASEDDHEGSSDEDDDDEDGNEAIQEDELLEFLSSLKGEFLSRLRGEVDLKDSLQSTICDFSSVLLPGITLYDHQIQATLAILQTRTGRFKGMILADPPGLGKTLPSLIAMAMSKTEGWGPSIVVAPTSCCLQWVHEAKRFLKPSFKTLLLTDKEASPRKIYEHDIIVTSYHHLAAEINRRAVYCRDLKNYKGKSSKKPKRLFLSLLSSFFDQSAPRGPLIILDEAHDVKRVSTKSHRAVFELRQQMETCVMLTGTPLDNTWRDGFGLLHFLHGHPFSSMAIYVNAFSQKVVGSPLKRKPAGRHLELLIQLFGACTLRRSQNLLHALLPSKSTEDIYFDVPDEQLKESNRLFDRFTEMNRIVANAKKGSGRAQPTSKADRKKKNKVALGWLIKSQQMTCHPKLMDVAEVEEKHSKAVHLKVALRKKVEALLQDLQDDGRWKSARIEAILGIVKRHQAEHSDDAFLIVDDSVLFLSILSIAFSKTTPDVKVFAFDGRSHPATRNDTLHAFSNANGPKAMLMSRAAGAVGLNVQAANVLIQCSPWWKSSWEDQAVGRVYRSGQEKHVYVYRMIAKKSLAEQHKSKVRDDKATITNHIMNALTIPDSSVRAASDQA